MINVEKDWFKIQPFCCISGLINKACFCLQCELLVKIRTLISMYFSLLTVDIYICYSADARYQEQLTYVSFIQLSSSESRALLKGP